jgi:hypothetical protein
MSVFPTYQDLSALTPLYYQDSDKKIEFVNENKFTLQGLNLLTYNINKSANDSFIKNYTVNNLIKNKDSNDIFNLSREIDTQDLNTKLNFKSTNTTLSSQFFLQALTTRDDRDSAVTFNLDLVDQNGDKFLVDFVNDDYCTISFFDGKIVKFLYDIGKEALVFKFLGTSLISLTGNYYFNYYYDNTNNKLRLFKNNQIISTLTTELTTNTDIVSSNPAGDKAIVPIILSNTINSIGKLTVNETNLKNGTINVDDKLMLFNTNNLDQFIYYDYENNHNLSNDSVSGVKYDFLTYYSYNDIISGDKANVNLKFFNLKNHISNNNITYAAPIENSETNLEYRGREYQNFTNQKSKEKDYDNITLNYTFFDKEFKISSKPYTEFTLPGNLFPFKKININDTSLADNGSFASNNPYFSDKIFKLTDVNKNNLQEIFIEDEEFLVNENDVSFLVLQSGGFFGFENLNDLDQNDIFGDYLCTWLKGDGKEKGTWFDRYYVPNSNSYTLPFTGRSNIFDSSTQASQYFQGNNSLVYYDLKSNLTFEPSASYAYQRINSNQINTYIDSQSAKLLKDTFSFQTSTLEIQNINEVNLDTIKGYDKLDLKSIPNKDFNIGFELELNSLSSLNSYQLFGNLYEDGFTFRNNNYFTPFVFITDGNKLFIYDQNFKLLRTNTYESTENIIDALYLEQSNNIVLICDNKIIKTNYFGEILNERYPEDGSTRSDLVEEIIKSYQSKTFHGYNNVFFITNNHVTNNKIINLDLNNLIPNENNVLNSKHSQLTAGPYQSIVPDGSGSYKFLVGKEPKKLDNNVSCSLESENRYIARQNIPGAAFLDSTVLSSELSGGIIKGQSFDEEYFSLIRAFSASAAGYNTDVFFNFVQEGRSRIVFDNEDLAQNEDPILDSLYSQVFDINSVGNRLFVQYVDLTANEGFVQEFTPERFKLSAFPLSETVRTGYKIDFIEENKQLKIMSFARDLSSNIVVDKINASTGKLEKTYNLNLTGVDTTERLIYSSRQDLPVTTFNGSSLSSVYPNGIYKYRRIEANKYNDIFVFNPALSAQFQILSGYQPHLTPINYYALDQKYSDYRDQLIFKFNLNSLVDVSVLTEVWEEAGPPLSATGHSQFLWNIPAFSLSGWDGEILAVSSEDQTNFEIIFTVPNVAIKNYINLDFNLNGGKIKLYNNGIVFGEVNFNPNIIPIEKILYPDMFINTQNIRNAPIDDLVDTNYNSSGGTLKNLKIHNTSFDESLVNYLELQTKEVDPLYFRVPCGTRNNKEEIDTLFTYKIPGNISNYIKVNIQDLNINNDIKNQLINYLQSSVEVVTPSQQQLIYNVE